MIGIQREPLKQTSVRLPESVLEALTRRVAPGGDLRRRGMTSVSAALEAGYYALEQQV